VPSNLDWVISNTDDAAAGLADGSYDAVITIPENFSAAATSTAPGKTPEKATIQVQTAPDGRVVDGAITATITQTAASVFGSAVSQQYLTNVLMGFTNLHDQLGQAAGGADQLASGAQQAATGAAQLPSGATARPRAQVSSARGRATCRRVSTSWRPGPQAPQPEPVSSSTG
jgi:putative membrane protein